MSTKERLGSLHIGLIGKLVSNLWALETYLRLFLTKISYENLDDFHSLSIGSELKIGEFNNWYQLSGLISKYNKWCNENDKIGLKINKRELLSIRDLVHHGSIIITKPEDEDNYILVKFSEPKDEKTKLENKIHVNKNNGEWLKKSIKIVYNALSTISNSYNKIN